MRGIVPSGGGGALAAVLVLCVAVSACSKPDPAVVKRESRTRGDQLLGQKQYAEAAAAYRVAVDADPLDGALRLHLARTYGQAGNWSAARDEAVRAADLRPQDRDAQLYAASLVLAWSGFTDAAHRARALLHDQPNHVDALLIAGNAMARLTNSVSAIEEVEKALRNGLPVRRPPRQGASPADDQEAEALFRKAIQIDPAHNEAQLALANLLIATGRDDEGVPRLLQVADRNPLHLFANRAAGVWLLVRGQAAAAERYLQVAHSLGDAVATCALADHYTRASRPERALQVLETLPASEDASGGVSVSAAMAEIRLGRHAAALSRIDRVLERLPGHAPALRLRAEILFARSEIDGALQAARAAVDAEPRSREGHVLFGRILAANGSYARAMAQLEKALHLDSSGSEILRELAAVALALGRTGPALEYARQAVRRDPADRAAAVLLVGALIRSRDPESAERTLAPLLAREPAAPDLLVLQGQILARRGITASARGVLTRALQAAPESVEAIVELVDLDLRDGLIAAARQRADRALAQRPADPRLLMLAARAGAAAGDWTAAEPKLRAVLEREPRHVEAAVALSDHLVRTGRRDEATRLLEAVLAQQPAGTDHGGTAPAAHQLATIYVDQSDRLDQALELARTAKEALPNDPAVSDTLGWVYVRRNLPESAIAHLEDAVRGAPENARYRYHLGIAYLRVGRPHDARTALTRALQLDSAMPEAPDARAALSSINR